MFIGLVGDTLAPSANVTAWFNTRTGKRVHPNGKPYYTGPRDFIRSSLVALFLGFIGGASIYGIVAIVRWILPNFDLGMFIAIVLASVIGIAIIAGIISSIVNNG